MPNHSRSQRPTPRRILSVESLENRRLLSGNGFFRFLEHHGVDVPNFVAQVDHFLNVHGLTAPQWFQWAHRWGQGYGFWHGQNSGPGHDSNALPPITIPSQGNGQAGNPLNLNALDTSVVVDATTNNTKAVLKAIEVWAKDQLGPIDTAGQLAQHNGHNPTDEGSSSGDSWIDDDAFTADFAMDDGSSSNSGAGRGAGQGNQVAELVPPSAAPLKAASESAAVAVALNTPNQGNDIKLSFDSVHARMTEAQSLNWDSGPAIPGPIFLEYFSQEAPPIVEQMQLLASAETQPAPVGKPNTRRSDPTAQAEQIAEAAQLVEAARSGEVLPASEPLASAINSRPGTTSTDPSLALLLQQQAAAAHNGNSTAESAASVVAHVGQGVLYVAEQADSHVLIGSEGTGDASSDHVDLALQGSKMLLNGLPLDTATLQRALQQFLSQANELGEELTKSLQMMGGSPWLMGLAIAGTAYEVVRRQQHGSRRKKGLASGEGRRTLTWIAGLPGSLSAEVA